MAFKVLITNDTLASRSGSALYLRDLALALLKRGHAPSAYSPVLGPLADDLRDAGIPLVDDLNQLASAPDVIHGHQHMETMTALLHFPKAPAIFVCHSPVVWYDQPISFPRILRYVAVDHACRDRLRALGSIPPTRIRVLLNFVDLDRFKTRPVPLPARPRRALVFSNYASEETHLAAVRDACRDRNIPLDVIGNATGQESPDPENLLGNYDLVFAKGRCALEAMAVGSAVVLCDFAGVGPMVTTAELDRLRPLNFGYKTLTGPLDTSAVVREIDRYDPDDAARVCNLIRATAGSETIVDQLVDLYHEVIEEHRTSYNGNPAEEGRFAAAYLRQLKIDFAIHGAASLRFRERIRNVPILGRWGLKLIHKLVGGAPSSKRP